MENKVKITTLINKLTKINYRSKLIGTIILTILFSILVYGFSYDQFATNNAGNIELNSNEIDFKFIYDFYKSYKNENFVFYYMLGSSILFSFIFSFLIFTPIIGSSYREYYEYKNDRFYCYKITKINKHDEDNFKIKYIDLNILVNNKNIEKIVPKYSISPKIKKWIIF